MPALDRITIEGFKSIKCLDLRLGQINVLIGPNGSGKSNVFGAMELLRATLHDDNEVDDHVVRSGGADKILHFGIKNTERINFEIESHAIPKVYGQELIASAGDRLLHEDFLSWGTKTGTSTNPIAELSVSSVATTFRIRVRRLR